MLFNRTFSRFSTRVNQIKHFKFLYWGRWKMKIILRDSFYDFWNSPRGEYWESWTKIFNFWSEFGKINFCLLFFVFKKMFFKPFIMFHYSSDRSTFINKKKLSVCHKSDFLYWKWFVCFSEFFLTVCSSLLKVPSKSSQKKTKYFMRYQTIFSQKYQLTLKTESQRHRSRCFQITTYPTFFIWIEARYQNILSWRQSMLQNLIKKF